MSAKEVEPRFAVIVAAYRRREYLAQALASVLAQRGVSSPLEIVVLTDFSDPELDRELRAHGVAHRVDAEPSIGRWLAGAVGATASPWVAIVEDDDLLEPSRLARVEEVLRAQPGLAYYRNRLTVVDGNGRAIPPSQWRPLERERFLDRHGPLVIEPGAKDAGIARMRAAGLEWLNLSTMVVRRELFEGSMRPVLERSECPDLFAFVSAGLAPGGMFLDDRRLTRYRRYAGNVSRSLAWRRRHEADHRLLLTAARERDGPPALIRWLADRTEMLHRVVEVGDALQPIRAGAPPEQASPTTRRYLELLRAEPLLAPPATLRWSAGAIASTYQFAPDLAARLLKGCDRWFDIP